LLPIEFFLNLTKIYVLQASFFGKASSWLSFGTISNYISNKTVHLETIEELAREIGIDVRDIAQMVPKEVLQEMRAKEAKESAERGREKRRTEGAQMELKQLPPPAIQVPGGLARHKSEDPPILRETITKLPIEAYVRQSSLSNWVPLAPPSSWKCCSTSSRTTSPTCVWRASSGSRSPATTSPRS
jgi:hypothetical protein